jgi:hypothetical protein
MMVYNILFIYKTNTEEKENKETSKDNKQVKTNK